MFGFLKKLDFGTENLELVGFDSEFFGDELFLEQCDLLVRPGKLRGDLAVLMAEIAHGFLRAAGCSCGTEKVTPVVFRRFRGGGDNRFRIVGFTLHGGELAGEFLLLLLEVADFTGQQADARVGELGVNRQLFLKRGDLILRATELHVQRAVFFLQGFQRGGAGDRWFSEDKAAVARRVDGGEAVLKIANLVLLGVELAGKVGVLFF